MGERERDREREREIKRQLNNKPQTIIERERARGGQREREVERACASNCADATINEH